MTTVDQPMLFPFAGDLSADSPPELARLRDTVPHLAFGHGPHHCVGAALARMELQIALRTLLTSMPTLRLAVPADQLRWRPGMLMRTLEELPVTW
jgi:cytochrome P450